MVSNKFNCAYGTVPKPKICKPAPDDKPKTGKPPVVPVPPCPASADITFTLQNPPGSSPATFSWYDFEQSSPNRCRARIVDDEIIYGATIDWNAEHTQFAINFESAGADYEWEAQSPFIDVNPEGGTTYTILVWDYTVNMKTGVVAHVTL